MNAMNVSQRRYCKPLLSTSCVITGGFLLASMTTQAAADTVGSKNTTSMKFGKTTVRIDRDMKAILDTQKALGAKPIEKLTPSVARMQPTVAAAVMALLKKRGMSTAPEPVGSVMDRTVPGPAGPVTVRVYKPRNMANHKSLPVLVYFHGGGFVIASVSTYDSSARALANAAKCMVVSVAYRMAPEHRLPAAHEDSYAVTQYLLKNAADWGGDPKRVAVGGESAGGNLATDMCLMARDRKGRMPIYQLLVYPLVDFTPASLNTPSAIRYAQAKPLNRPMLKWFSRYALPRPSFANNPLASPLRRANVKGIPAATFVQAEIDPLLSGGVAYSNKLKRAGIPVRMRLYRGVTHEFFGTGAVVPLAKDAVKFAAQGLRTAFDR